MRSAGNFHPDWGYLAPAPSFMRTVRIALVATAIGAIAGAVVVVSLIERPGGNDDNTSIASHALVISAPTLTSPAAASADAKPALAPTPASVKTLPVAASPPVPVPSSEPAAADVASSGKSSTMSSGPAPVTPSAGPAGVAVAPPPVEAAPASAPATPGASAVGVAATQPATEAAPASTPAATPDTAAAKRAASRRRREEYESARRSYARRRWRDDGGFGPFFHLFSFGGGDSSYSN
jgi:hypothetical protein